MFRPLEIRKFVYERYQVALWALIEIKGKREQCKFSGTGIIVLFGSLHKTV